MISLTLSEVSSQVMYDVIPWRNKAPERWELLKERRINAKIKSIKEIKIKHDTGKLDTINIEYREYDKFFNNTVTILYDESKNIPKSKFLKYFDDSNNEIASADYNFNSGQFIRNDSSVKFYNTSNKIVSSYYYELNNRLKSYSYYEYDSLMNLIYNEGYFIEKNRFNKVQNYLYYNNGNVLEYTICKRLYIKKEKDVSFKIDTIYNKSNFVSKYREIKFDSSGNLIEFIDTTPGMKIAKFYFSYDNNDNLAERTHIIGNEISFRIVYTYNDKLLLETEDKYDSNNVLEYTNKFIYEYYE